MREAARWAVFYVIGNSYHIKMLREDAADAQRHYASGRARRKNVPWYILSDIMRKRKYDKK